jgi:hypothetical protein
MFRLLLVFVTLTLFALSSEAAIYKGQRVFMKKCLPCHKEGQELLAKYKIYEWQKWMKKQGAPLAEQHLKSEKAQESWDYFKSAKYRKDAKHLKQFLIEYAQDSGNIPACN